MFLFPVPKSLQTENKNRDLSSSYLVILPEGAGFPLKKRVVELVHGLVSFLQVPKVSMGCPSETGRLLVQMFRRDGLGKEEYVLSLGETGGICLEASYDAGFFYGMQSAVQLLAKPSKVPMCVIHDSPSLGVRGYMLDVSRDKIPTMSTMKSLVESLAKLRYNSLQLYMEHAFAFAGHERVWAQYTPFSAEDIMELDLFCQEHFIELVPNLNSFGHLEKWLCHEEYQELAECNPPYYCPEYGRNLRSVLSPSQRSLDFVDGLYREFLPNFTSRKLNIGCDETVELGKGKSAETCAKRGVARVYLDFLSQLVGKAHSYGFSVQFWGDIIMHTPELISSLPGGVTALEWGYEADHPFEKDTLAFKESGIPFIVCPGTSSWNSYLGRTRNMLGNISNAIGCACKNGALGMLMTDWGDSGHHQYYPISWPGITMGGGAAWNADERENAEILPYGISWAFAAGEEGELLGKFLLKIGHVNDCFSTPCVNCTPYGEVFASYPYGVASRISHIFSRVKPEELDQAEAQVNDLLEELFHSPFKSFPLENSELENGLRMTLSAIVFIRRALGGVWNRLQWQDGMRHVIAQHETLWLARGRNGGLFDSVSYLRNALEFDPDSWKNDQGKLENTDYL